MVNISVPKHIASQMRTAMAFLPKPAFVPFQQEYVPAKAPPPRPSRAEPYQAPPSRVVPDHLRTLMTNDEVVDEVVVVDDEPEEFAESGVKIEEVDDNGVKIEEVEVSGDVKTEVKDENPGGSSTSSGMKRPGQYSRIADRGGACFPKGTLVASGLK